MSRQTSIPMNLESAILRRWVEGSSPRAIHQWIVESNPTRKAPVETSPSSVLRCIERAAAKNSRAACLASVHRARLRSTTLMNTLEEVDDGYRKVFDEASRSPREYPNNRVNGALKALGKLELSTHRQLKLAGVGTAFGHKLAEEQKAASLEMARDIAAEDELEDAGLAPEVTVRHLPPELFPPAPLTPEIIGLLRREQVRLSESKPLVSQPIDDSNRNTVTAPPAAGDTTSVAVAPAHPEPERETAAHPEPSRGPAVGSDASTVTVPPTSGSETTSASVGPTQPEPNHGISGDRPHGPSAAPFETVLPPGEGQRA